MATDQQETMNPPARKSLQDLAKAAGNGSEEALVELRRELAERPDVWDSRTGNPAAMTEDLFLAEWSKRTQPNGTLGVEALRLKFRTIKAEMAGPNPSPLEEMLAERIAHCWFQVQDAAVKEQASICLDGKASAKFHGERQARAHKMLMSAIKALAQVRKLDLPNIQVNVGDRQIIVQTEG
jgi:hypothetical protein